MHAGAEKNGSLGLELLPEQVMGKRTPERVTGREETRSQRKGTGFINRG